MCAKAGRYKSTTDRCSRSDLGSECSRFQQDRLFREPRSPCSVLRHRLQLDRAIIVSSLHTYASSQHRLSWVSCMCDHCMSRLTDRDDLLVAIVSVRVVAELCVKAVTDCLHCVRFLHDLSALDAL